ncbi:hypothetical protein HAX54_011566, partial [Datura stramonium]|nr:hypothetical protein [Datura stramonium]
EPSEEPGATAKRSNGKSVVEESSKGWRYPKTKGARGCIFDQDITKLHGMQELLEMVRYQGWEHLFELPMPVKYDSEVFDFYSTLLFTDDEEIVYATVGGVEISF